MLYNKNDIFEFAKSGFAMLPNIFKYNDKDPSQVSIDLPEEDILTYILFLGKKFIKNPASVKKLKEASYVVTLSRIGFEKYKKQLWEEFNNYQTNNKPKYYIGSGKKFKYLTEDQFYNCFYDQYILIEKSTMKEMFRTEIKYEKLKSSIQIYKLPYAEYKEKKLKELEELGSPTLPE